VSLRSESDEPTQVRFVPLGLDPVVLFARRSSLRALHDVPAMRLASERVSVVDAIGSFLRAARVPSDELDGWGAWDVAMASVALSNGYAALARVPAMRARLESLLDGIVDRIATFPRAEADGDNALVVTVCVAWERAHAAPPGAPEEDHARWLDAASEAWGTAQTWALPLTGNLPGPPSVTGAILNIYAKSLIPTLGQAPPTAGPGGRRLLDAVARAQGTVGQRLDAVIEGFLRGAPLDWRAYFVAALAMTSSWIVW
jgi:hypothetical protein